jgi:hypothetical protein
VAQLSHHGLVIIQAVGIILGGQNGEGRRYHNHLAFERFDGSQQVRLGWWIQIVTPLLINQNL